MPIVLYKLIDIKHTVLLLKTQINDPLSDCLPVKHPLTLLGFVVLQTCVHYLCIMGDHTKVDYFGNLAGGAVHGDLADPQGGVQAEGGRKT